MATFDFNFSISIGDIANLLAISTFIYSRHNKGITPRQYHTLLKEIIDLKRQKGDGAKDGLS